ncbi:MAG: phosphotransferase [Bacteroidales bacterium]|nr:phosphotransferase [Bacteroidales bacterium]
MNKDEKKKILNLYEKWAGEDSIDIDLLPESGSYRRYYRIKSKHKHALGAYFESPNENKAFIELSRYFRKNGLNVPEIYLVDDDFKAYLLEDLGDSVLFNTISDIKKKHGFNDELVGIYKNIIDDLVNFQIVVGENVDYSVCYPSGDFDTQAYMWDLNYFKYNFLKLAQIPHNEYYLEEDFRKLVQLLMSVDSSYFVYRDFQTRNIMQYKNKLYFIDYQGGRRGPVHYDLVSLLFQARVAMPAEIREHLIDYYIHKAEKIAPHSVKDFRHHFYKFVLIRILQTLGAYGFRGIHEKKQHFLKSIPQAINNIKWLMENKKIPHGLDELMKCLNAIIHSEELQNTISPPLKIIVNSFSFKRGVPPDNTGNGGGFVFDCRALPNPGRIEEYKKLNGKDQQVIDFFEKHQEVEDFITHAEMLVEQSVKVYDKRGFTNLQVNFGCTGGQHRSVYCAEKMAQRLYLYDNIKIEIHHREQDE